MTGTDRTRVPDRVYSLSVETEPLKSGFASWVMTYRLVAAGASRSSSASNRTAGRRAPGLRRGRVRRGLRIVRITGATGLECFGGKCPAGGKPVCLFREPGERPGSRKGNYRA